MRRGSWVLIAGLLVTSAGCRKSGAAADGNEFPPTGTPVRVYVTNHWEQAMEVSVVAAGSTYRLGLVSPGIDRSFVLPQAALAAGGRVEFIAQPSGVAAEGRSGPFGRVAPSARSGEISVSPGDIVDFEITTFLGDSRATVRQ